MNYDFIKKVEVNTYPNDNISVKSSRSKRKISAFGIIFTQLAICIAASLIYMAVTVFSNLETLGLDNIFKGIMYSGIL